MSKEDVQKRIEQLMQAMTASVERLEGGYLRPMQKQAFLCSAKCCDSSSSQQALQQWWVLPPTT